MKCSRCPKTIRYPQADCWKDLGVCPKCYLTNTYKFKAIALEIGKNASNAKINPVDDYWNWVTRQWLRTNTI